MTPLDIARLRLRCQHLSSAPFQDPVEVVRWLTAVQSQDYYGAKWALGLRLQDAIETDLDDAFFNSGAILRTHVLRPTWHFVTPEDIRWLLQLTGPRVLGINASMYRQLELDEATLQRSLDVIAQALQGGQHLTRAELGEVLQNVNIAGTSGQRLTYVVMHAEQNGVICSGPRRGKQFTYALLDEWVPPAPELSRDAALAELTRRFFLSHGPATVHDFANWSGLTVRDGRSGLALVQTELEHAEIDNHTYWFSPDPPPEIEHPPRAFILSVFDEYGIGYKDRSAITSDAVSARLGNLGNALTYLLVLDGQVIGSCRRTLQKDTVTIELSSFQPLTIDEQQAITEAAQRFSLFLQLGVELVWE